MVVDSNPVALAVGGGFILVAARRWSWIRTSVKVHQAITTGERFHCVNLCRARVDLNEMLCKPSLIGPNANVFGKKACDGTIIVHVISNKPAEQLEEDNANEAVLDLATFTWSILHGVPLFIVGVVGF
jgi:hypothetical protein